MKKRNQHINTSISSSINGVISRSTGGLTVSLDGIIAHYAPGSVFQDSANPLWYDVSVGTRPNGKTSGAPFDNWTGLAFDSTGSTGPELPPVFDGVNEACGTGQAYNPSMMTHLDYRYQEAIAGLPAPMEIAAGTIECWVNRGGSVFTMRSWALAYHYLIGLGMDGGEWAYQWFQNSSPYTMVVHSGVSVTSGWTHLVLTFTSGGTADLWVNGEKKVAGGGFNAAHTTNRAWYIGDGVNSNAPWSGEIDTVRFYNRILTDGEITGNYNAEKGSHI